MLHRTYKNELPLSYRHLEQGCVLDCAERGLHAMEIKPSYGGDISPHKATAQMAGFDMTARMFLSFLWILYRTYKNKLPNILSSPRTGCVLDLQRERERGLLAMEIKPSYGGDISPHTKPGSMAGIGMTRWVLFVVVWILPKPIEANYYPIMIMPPEEAGQRALVYLLVTE